MNSPNRATLAAAIGLKDKACPTSAFRCVPRFRTRLRWLVGSNATSRRLLRSTKLSSVYTQMSTGFNGTIISRPIKSLSVFQIATTCCLICILVASNTLASLSVISWTRAYRCGTANDSGATLPLLVTWIRMESRSLRKNIWLKAPSEALARILSSNWSVRRWKGETLAKLSCLTF